MDVVNATINATLENATDAANATKKEPDSPEGLFVAYFSLFVMALGPIYIGSLRSVNALIRKKSTGEEVETITSHDAAMFPLFASGALFGIYLIFKFFSKEYLNLLLTFYFFVLGTLALGHILSPILRKILPACFPNAKYHLKLAEEKEGEETTSEQDDQKKDLIDFNCDRKDLIGLAVGFLIGLWYLKSKHWIANNLFGLAFSVNAVELLQLNKVVTGCILLGGLFVYDIFWVFGTNVMVTVATSFEAPIKLIFPRDVITKGFGADNFAMLGLGDIVIPGIFIALLLRFDNSLNKGKRTYFFTGFVAYIVGLLTTIFVMHVFKHAQPALLYLVPACLGAPILLACIKGDVKAMFSYEDSPEKAATTDGEGDTKKEK